MASLFTEDTNESAETNPAKGSPTTKTQRREVERATGDFEAPGTTLRRVVQRCGPDANRDLSLQILP